MEERVDAPTMSTRRATSSRGRVEVEAHRPRAGVLVLQVRGDLVADTAAELERRLTEALAEERHHRRVVVDLSGVVTITAPGLDVLLDVQDRLTAAGGRLELLAPSPPVILLLHDAAAS